MPDRINILIVVVSGAIAVAALYLAWLEKDHALFDTLAGSLSGAFLTTVNYYFGSSRDKKPPIGGANGTS